MSATTIAWIVIAAVTALLSFHRPVWAIAFYMQTFFAAPQLWWWGDEIPSARYALWAGVLLLVTVLASLAQPREGAEQRWTHVHTAGVLMVLNATFVHTFIAVDRAISLDTYTELMKYVLLFFLMWKAIHTRKDFHISLMAIAIGAAYIGWEVAINGRGDFSGSRLEGVGAPGADTSNSLASVMLTVLPLIGSLFVDGSIFMKLSVIVAAPLALNLLLLCNSRGAFLGLIGSGIAFLVVSRGKTRKIAIRTIALGAVALYLLLGDPKILDRFSTTFVGSEQRDNSASSRLDFWQAGFLMLNDYPLGAGGGAFKFNLGRRYLERVVGADAVDRSLHNGYLTEATDWGVQGLFLKLLFFGAAITAAYRTANRCRLAGRLKDALTGICMIVAAVGLLIHCFFGSFLANEWAYWVVALVLRYSELYNVEAVAVGATASSDFRSGGRAA